MHRKKLPNLEAQDLPAVKQSTESPSVPVKGTLKSRVCKSLEKKLKRTAMALHGKSEKEESYFTPSQGNHLKFFLAWLLLKVKDLVRDIRGSCREDTNKPLGIESEMSQTRFPDLLHSQDCPKNKNKDASPAERRENNGALPAEIDPEETSARISGAVEDLGTPANMINEQQGFIAAWIVGMMKEQQKQIRDPEAEAKSQKPRKASRKIKKVVEEMKVADSANGGAKEEGVGTVPSMKPGESDDRPGTIVSDSARISQEAVGAPSSKLSRTPSPTGDIQNGCSSSEGKSRSSSNSSNSDDEEYGKVEAEPALPGPLTLIEQEKNLAAPANGREEYVDHGTFDFSDICIALGKGELDEQRKEWLHEAFVTLINDVLGMEEEL